MRTLLVLLLSAAVCFGAQAKKSGGGNPATLLTQLQNDVKAAMGNAFLKDKDTKKLEKAIERLQKQVDNRAAGKRLDPGEIRKSVDDITGVAKQFKEDDQRAVIRTVNEIRDRKLDVDKESNKGMKGVNQNPRVPGRNPNINNPFPGTTPRRR